MTTFTSSPTSWIRGVDRSTRPLPLPPPSPSLNSLTTGLWVPRPHIWRFLYKLCLGRRFKKTTAREPFSSSSFTLCFLLSRTHWRTPSPAHDHSFSPHSFRKGSQAIRSNEDLILRRYPCTQSDFPFSFYHRVFLFMRFESKPFLIRLLFTLNLL